jgi:organic radical activating enzyme
VYLMVTSKCNMKCQHCCYSCGKNGKHMTRNTWQQSLRFAEGYDNEVIAIGGGEPTLHPDFFEILQRCIWDFNYIWMATNGSRTKVMWRLVNILEGEDYPKNEDEGIYLKSEDQLCVALSNDYFHDPIDDKIMNYWEKQSKTKGNGFEMRDVTKRANGPVEMGRAKKTQSGWATDCCCSDVQILPTGKIRMCGCKNSPIIGDVWNGIEDKWQKHMEEDESFLDTRCFNGEPISAHT